MPLGFPERHWAGTTKKSIQPLLKNSIGKTATGKNIQYK